MSPTTGVTCYTCHRGQPVPANIWFNNPGPAQCAAAWREKPTGKNHPPAPWLATRRCRTIRSRRSWSRTTNIRVEAHTALPGGDHQSIKQTDWTYALMMHFSQSLGRELHLLPQHAGRSRDWAQSTPQRVTAWYGIRMVRDLNNNYLDPLHDVFPPARLGPPGDVPKVNCATCHQGVYKPLFGADVLKNYPELAGPTPETLHSATAAPASTVVAATSPQ